MHLSEIHFDESTPITGYGPGFFRVGAQIHHGPMLVLAQRVIPWGGLADAACLLNAAHDLDVLFIGMGADVAPLPVALRKALESGGLRPDPMATPAACRTYNVLLSEGRRVGAALLPV